MKHLLFDSESFFSFHEFLPRFFSPQKFRLQSASLCNLTKFSLKDLFAKCEHIHSYLLSVYSFIFTQAIFKGNLSFDLNQLKSCSTFNFFFTQRFSIFLFTFLNAGFMTYLVLTWPPRNFKTLLLVPETLRHNQTSIIQIFLTIFVINLCHRCYIRP